jgi:hypothetical protein
MSRELTEEEMRQALFGNAPISASESPGYSTALQADFVAAPIPQVVKKEGHQDLHPEAPGYSAGEQRV